MPRLLGDVPLALPAYLVAPPKTLPLTDLPAGSSHLHGFTVPRGLVAARPPSQSRPLSGMNSMFPVGSASWKPQCTAGGACPVAKPSQPHITCPSCSSREVPVSELALQAVGRAGWEPLDACCTLSSCTGPADLLPSAGSPLRRPCSGSWLGG